MRTPRPPRLAGRLLDLVDPRGTVRGDLDEEYLRFRRGERGRIRSDLWYWSQTLRSLLWLWTRPRRSVPGSAARSLRLDLAQATRMLRRRPGPSLLIVGTLGLALGVNTSVFSLAHTIALRPLPFANEDRLVRIHPDELFYIDLEGAQRVAAESTSLERVLPWGRSLFTLTGSDPAEELRGATVAHDHFSSLGARPLLGRSFRPQDALAEPVDALILAHGVWTRRFGADPAVVGTRIEVGGRLRTLIGVMGPGHVPMEPDWEAWQPLPADPAAAAGRALALNGLLRSGVSLESARTDLRRALASAWAADGYVASEDEVSAIDVVSLRDHLLGDVRRPLLVLLGAVGFVLLLACANVATLLLGQGSMRGREVAVRSSLGAGRHRILGQLGLEVLLLALLGAALAVLLAAGLQHWAADQLPADFPRATQWSMGTTAILYTLAVSGLAALLAGALPAWKTAGGGRSATVLRGEGLRSASRLSSALVGLQVALSVLLVVGAGLMTRSFLALSSVDPGFTSEGAVAVRVAPPSGRYQDAEGLDGFYRRVREAALATPGIEAVGGIIFLPMTPGGAWTGYRPEGAPGFDDDLPSTAFRIVTPGYFDAMGIPLRAGRYPDQRDGPDDLAVAVVNETLARNAFGSRAPLGEDLVLGGQGSDTVRVVGVVGDVHQSDLRTGTHPELYRPLAQLPYGRLYMVARTSGDEDRAVAELQAAVLAVDGDVILSRAGPVAGLVRGTMGDTRLLMQLLGLFGLVALLLGAIGIYGVTAHDVAVRRRETGIRLALGADAGRMATRTMLLGLAPVGVGVVMGLVAAAAAAGTMESLLFQIEPLDPVTFGLVPAFFGLVASLALARPALRIGRTDPVETLRPD